MTDQDLQKMQRQIGDIKRFFRDIEAMGGTIPDGLKKSINRLQIAVSTGQDIGNAAAEASGALKVFESDLLSACKSIDGEMDMVCAARITRQWQARSVSFVLDYRNKDSVAARFIKKTVERYTPKIICAHWDYCSQQAGKSAPFLPPKKGDKVSLTQTLRITGNIHVKPLSNAAPPSLPKGTPGVITAVDQTSVTVELKWYSPRDLTLKIAKTAWGQHFR
ncbi:hypothetical protein ACRARG_04310 [Pseudooceanicola sp. C21-150M6]|uniref:hypothetical protein n=1 Tax=Pseudooceanicola sp. C21-150M6 TaxID=3434355 RepID=UPI003D7F2E9A